MSLRAYQQAATRAENPREMEYRLFGQVTRALMDASQAPADDIATRIDALDWNRKVWSTLATDCSQPEKPAADGNARQHHFAEPLGRSSLQRRDAQGGGLRAPHRDQPHDHAGACDPRRRGVIPASGKTERLAYLFRKNLPPGECCIRRAVSFWALGLEKTQQIQCDALQRRARPNWPAACDGSRGQNARPALRRINPTKTVGAKC